MLVSTSSFPIYSSFDATVNATEETLPESSTLQKALSYSLTGVIALMMLGVGCGVNVIEMKPHFKRPVGIAVGFLCQFCKCKLNTNQGYGEQSPIDHRWLLLFHVFLTSGDV